MSSAQELSVTLTMPEWQIIYAGLGELPFKAAAPVAAKVQQQLAAQAQLQAAAETHPPQPQEATP